MNQDDLYTLIVEMQQVLDYDDPLYTALEAKRIEIRIQEAIDRDDYIKSLGSK